MRTWAFRCGATSRQVLRILALLNLEWMCVIPLPPRTYRKPGTLEHQWNRYLFRRHIQHILHWTTRREESDPEGFGVEVNKVIRERLFPEPAILEHGEVAVRSEEARGESSGGQNEAPSRSDTDDWKRGDCARTWRHGRHHSTSPALSSGVAGTDVVASGTAGGAAPSGRNWRGSPVSKPRESTDTAPESRNPSLHLGTNNTSEWQGIRFFCLAPGRDATDIPNVEGSAQCHRRPQAVESGYTAEAHSCAKRRRRGQTEFAWATATDADK